jgi:hypothetical protein
VRVISKKIAKGTKGEIETSDLFVDDLTWSSFSEAPVTKALAGHDVRLPRPEHLVALKLHAAKGAGPQRIGKTSAKLCAFAD